MLPKAVPNTRIMRYGYQSKWFGKEATQQRATSVAQMLLTALERERKVCLYATSLEPGWTLLNTFKEFPVRPLVFIAHCFGGLVVLKVCVLCIVGNIY